MTCQIVIYYQAAHSTSIDDDDDEYDTYLSQDVRNNGVAGDIVVKAGLVGGGGGVTGSLALIIDFCYTRHILYFLFPVPGNTDIVYCLVC